MIALFSATVPSQHPLFQFFCSHALACPGEPSIKPQRARLRGGSIQMTIGFEKFGFARQLEAVWKRALGRETVAPIHFEAYM